MKKRALTVVTFELARVVLPGRVACLPELLSILVITIIILCLLFEGYPIVEWKAFLHLFSQVRTSVWFHTQIARI